MLTARSMSYNTIYLAHTQKQNMYLEYCHVTLLQSSVQPLHLLQHECVSSNAPGNMLV